TQLTQLTLSNDNSATTSAQKNNEVEELRLQLEQITGEVEQLKITIQELESEKSKSQANIQQLNTTLQAEQETIHQLESDLEEKQKRLDILGQQIEIKDITINSLQLEKRNAEQKNKADETKNQQNQTQGISQELQSLVDQYNQSKGDLNVLKVSSVTPVKDASDQGNSVIKVKKADGSEAKFYIIIFRQELYLFPKLEIGSSFERKGFDRYFDCPRWNGSTIDIQLVTPPKMKPISGTKDSWELVDKNSKGKVT
ncbi:MAG TPA: hypothetical protein DCQ63_00460, partial [Planktothrix sp. UBA8402]|nr:hypothetical protein [Planktothrix sp. UBA8402]